MDKLNFLSWLPLTFERRRDPIMTNHGSREEQDYQPVYDHNGVWHLEPTKMINRYLDIQSHADSCDINVIMARYRNGETDVLSRMQGVYGDVTNVPTNYADICNQRLKAEQLFMSLKPEIREKYGNSVEQFMASFSTKQGWEDIGFKFDGDDSNTKSAPDVSDKEVTQDA